MIGKRIAMGLAPLLLAAMAGPASADFFFSTGDPDGRIATGSRPESVGKVEVESADDFVLKSSTKLTSATFTGLLPSGAALSDVVGVTVEIYRVFPKDSQFPPSGNVPTRDNSPSDIAFDSRSSSDSGLSFTTNVLSQSFTAANSVLNGIKVNAGGEGAVTGQEVQFNVNFTDPFSLPADHYFFVPQVELANGDFLWLSAAKPIVPPGTPFTPDLQTWIRNEPLQPDWLRVGTDIVGGGVTFNAAFSLTGRSVPEPGSFVLAGLGGLALAGGAWRRRVRAAKA